MNRHKCIICKQLRNVEKMNKTNYGWLCSKNNSKSTGEYLSNEKTSMEFNKCKIELGNRILKKLDTQIHNDVNTLEELFNSYFKGLQEIKNVSSGLAILLQI